MPTVLDVRRFTAPDMFGPADTPRRRRIICAELVVGCPAAFLLGILTLHSGQILSGSCVIGIALNYLPLAAHAVSLFPPGEPDNDHRYANPSRATGERAAANTAFAISSTTPPTPSPS